MYELGEQLRILVYMKRKAKEKTLNNKIKAFFNTSENETLIMHYENRKTKRNVQEKKVGENFLKVCTLYKYSREVGRVIKYKGIKYKED